MRFELELERQLEKHQSTSCTRDEAGIRTLKWHP